MPDANPSMFGLYDAGSVPRDPSAPGASCGLAQLPTVPLLDQTLTSPITTKPQ